MPTYQYHCANCGADLEIFQRMTDPTLTVCPECEGELRKIYAPVGIVFKGSGFYATDSKKSTKPAPNRESSSAKNESTDHSSGSEKTATKDAGSTTKESSSTSSAATPASGSSASPSASASSSSSSAKPAKAAASS
ncbi:MAG: hypothetical protein LBM23_06390 [Propionibacteriaceae bacterium]|jgi:putative FmdB family regulatory protein|nr:hypothetical protein [Propionibacteriaceae bacterium]